MRASQSTTAIFARGLTYRYKRAAKTQIAGRKHVSFDVSRVADAFPVDDSHITLRRARWQAWQQTLKASPRSESYSSPAINNWRSRFAAATTSPIFSRRVSYRCRTFAGHFSKVPRLRFRLRREGDVSWPRAKAESRTSRAVDYRPGRLHSRDAEARQVLLRLCSNRLLAFRAISRFARRDRTVASRRARRTRMNERTVASRRVA